MPNAFVGPKRVLKASGTAKGTKAENGGKATPGQCGKLIGTGVGSGRWCPGQRRFSLRSRIPTSAGFLPQFYGPTFLRLVPPFCSGCEGIHPLLLAEQKRVCFQIKFMENADVAEWLFARTSSTESAKSSAAHQRPILFVGDCRGQKAVWPLPTQADNPAVGKVR